MKNEHNETECRAFIALPIPDDIIRKLNKSADALNKLLPPRAVRWTPPEQLHLTLRFMGRIKTEDIEPLQQTLRNTCAEFNPFILETTSWGCFPGAHKPRVLWIGLDDVTGILGRLQTQISSATAGWGEHNEQKKFHPHLTIGRFRNLPPHVLNQAREILRNPPSLTRHQFAANEIRLMRSRLTPQGAIHDILGSFPLAGV
ncbi:MAG: RNA 2',3'-cyclic phosphodiesterase [Verrucomicrobia bacterium]|nr:RNA 2',3'-cyclic phosphodiesterase [Verrucomicrobiota bacterium]MCF7709196.1 RNA 2',3'-cyclic phosphodiesterase [Verrucomicrobiota bacterium]